MRPRHCSPSRGRARRLAPSHRRPPPSRRDRSRPDGWRAGARNAPAIPSPMPLAAPVTTATLSLRTFMEGSALMRPRHFAPEFLSPLIVRVAFVLPERGDDLGVGLLQRPNEFRVWQYPEVITPYRRQHDASEIDRIDALRNDRLQTRECLGIGAVVTGLRISARARQHRLMDVGVHRSGTQQRHADAELIELNSQ